MPKLSRSNPLALAVLISLTEAPAHPYQVAQLLRSRAKEESVRLNFGSLYAVFESLEKRGLIKARETLREGRRPERTVYEVTEAGTREALDWLSDMLAVPVKEYPQLMTALSFMPALPPEEVLTALEDRAKALELRLVKIRGMVRAAAEMGFPRLFEIETEYEQFLLEAERAFVERLAKEIRDGSLDGLELWRGFHADDETRQRLLAEIGGVMPWERGKEAPPADV